MESKRKRKALGDCTNTTPLVKEPSIASSIKTILNHTSGKAVIRSNSESVSTTTVTKRSTREIAPKNPCSPAIASSSPPQSLRLSGTCGESQVVEPFSVYSRRTDKKNRKGTEVALPLDASRAVNFDTLGDKSKKDGDTILSKSLTQHHKKKKKDDSQHIMTQDFIEKQRAYFAEIDAFELAEEEVETIDQLE